MEYWEKFELFTEELCRKALLYANKNNVEVHCMSHGSQGGRDVVACYVDSGGHSKTIYIECKYYRTRSVVSSELSQKADQVKNQSIQPHHWILFAPEYSLDNEADTTIARLRQSEFLDFDIHRWDSGNHVNAAKLIFDSCRDATDISSALESPAFWHNHSNLLQLFSDALVNLKPQRKLQSKSITFLTPGLFNTGDTHPEHFFHGQPISWRLLSSPDGNRFDIPRTVTNQLKDIVAHHKTTAAMPRLLLKVVTGHSGNGKTTLLRRLASDLYHEGYAVWYLERATDDDAQEIYGFMMKTVNLIANRQPVIIADWLPGAEKCLLKIAAALENQGVKAIGLAAGTDSDWGQVEEHYFHGNLVRIEPAGVTLYGAPDRVESDMLLSCFEKIFTQPLMPRETVLEKLCQMPTILHAIAAISSQDYQREPDEILRRWVYKDHKGLPQTEQKAHAWITLAASHGAAIAQPLLNSLISDLNSSQVESPPLFKIKTERWTAGAMASLDMCIVSRDRHHWYGAHAGRSIALWSAIHKEYEKLFLTDLASLQVQDRQDWLISAFFFGRALVRLGDGVVFQIGRKLLEALADYSGELSARKRTSLNSCLELGKIYIKKDSTTAQKYFNKIVELEPNNLHAHLELGRLMVLKGDRVEAERLFNRYLEIEPNNLHAHLELGRLMVLKGDRVEAERLFNRYLEIEPNNLHAHLELGRLMVLKGDRVEAERLFKKCLEIEPNGVHAHLELGRLMVLKGDRVEAERLFKKCLEIDKTDNSSRLELIKLLLSQGDLLGAYEIARLGAKHFQMDAHIAQELGLALYRENNITLGMALLSYSYTLESDDEKSFCYLAIRALTAKGALLRLLKNTILDGPIDKLGGFGRKRVEELIAFTLNIQQVEGFEGQQKGTIASRGFVPQEGRFFVTPDRKFPKGDLCCFMNEWIGFIRPSPGMRVSFEIAAPINPLKGHSCRAINVCPDQATAFTFGSCPELPENPF